METVFGDKLNTTHFKCEIKQINPKIPQKKDDNKKIQFKYELTNINYLIILGTY